jgi:hypothetical protein
MWDTRLVSTCKCAHTTTSDFAIYHNQNPWWKEQNAFKADMFAKASLQSSFFFLSRVYNLQIGNNNIVFDSVSYFLLDALSLDHAWRGVN